MMINHKNKAWLSILALCGGMFISTQNMHGAWHSGITDRAKQANETLKKAASQAEETARKAASQAEEAARKAASQAAEAARKAASQTEEAAKDIETSVKSKWDDVTSWSEDQLEYVKDQTNKAIAQVQETGAGALMATGQALGILDANKTKSPPQTKLKIKNMTPQRIFSQVLYAYYDKKEDTFKSQAYAKGMSESGKAQNILILGSKNSEDNTKTITINNNADNETSKLNPAGSEYDPLIVAFVAIVKDAESGDMVIYVKTFDSPYPQGNTEIKITERKLTTQEKTKMEKQQKKVHTKLEGSKYVPYTFDIQK